MEAAAGVLSEGIPPTAAPDLVAPAQSAEPRSPRVTDLRVVATGPTWVDLAWTSIAGPEGYGVWVARSAPAALIAESGIPPEEDWPAPGADTIQWTIAGDPPGVEGSIFAHVVRTGTCAFPVLARSAGEEISCRAEDLPERTPVTFLLRPFTLETTNETASQEASDRQ